MGRLIKKRGKTTLSGPAWNVEFYIFGEKLISSPAPKDIKREDPQGQFLIFCINLFKL
jgi:hypothetical protein